MIYTYVSCPGKLGKLVFDQVEAKKMLEKMRNFVITYDKFGNPSLLPKTVLSLYLLQIVFLEGYTVVIHLSVMFWLLNGVGVGGWGEASNKHRLLTFLICAVKYYPSIHG